MSVQLIAQELVARITSEPMETLSTSESLLTSVARAESSATFRPRTQHPYFQEPANVQRVKQVQRSCSVSRWLASHHSGICLDSTRRTIRSLVAHLRPGRITRPPLRHSQHPVLPPVPHPDQATNSIIQPRTLSTRNSPASIISRTLRPRPPPNIRHPPISAHFNRRISRAA